MEVIKIVVGLVVNSEDLLFFKNKDSRNAPLLKIQNISKIIQKLKCVCVSISKSHQSVLELKFRTSDTL